MLTCKVGKNIIDTFSHKNEQLREWSNKGLLKCPVCGEKMIYCHGDYKIPYFRHEKDTDCPDKYSEGITQEHINGIKILYEWLKTQKDIADIQLEKWIEETRQRPDIYFKYNNKEYVIEYQCSPISTQYAKRHDLYKLEGIKDIWILGTNKYFDDKFNYIEKNIYKGVLFEKKFKTIESEILESNCNLIYLNNINGRLYITNKELTKNSTRTRTGYYSGQSYKEKLKTIFDCNLRSINIKEINLYGLNDENIKDYKDNYINEINNKEITLLKESLRKDINLEIIEELKYDDSYRIRYTDVNNKEYTITYNYLNNEIEGFKYNNCKVNLYYNYDDTLCMKSNNKKDIFKYLIEDYCVIGDTIKTEQDIYGDFNTKKQLAIYNDKNKLQNIINDWFSLFNNYMKYKICIDFDMKISFYKTKFNKECVQIQFKYKECIENFVYDIDDFSVKNTFDRIENYIIKNIVNEVDNIDMLHDLKEHYKCNLNKYFNYISIIQNVENENIIYHYYLDFDGYKDAIELIIKNDIIEINNEKFHFNHNNKRKILMNIISTEFRKRKYNL